MNVVSTSNKTPPPANADQLGVATTGRASCSCQQCPGCAREDFVLIKVLQLKFKRALDFISSQDSTSQLNFTFGELTVVLNKSPWQMTIIDRVTQLNLLTETSDSEYRLVSIWHVSAEHA